MLEQRLNLNMRQTQRLIMTPRMQQSIHLLQLATLELQGLIQKELVENPLLEEQTTSETSGTDSTPVEGQDAEKKVDQRIDDEADGKVEFDEQWQEYFADSSDVGYIPPSTAETSEIYEAPIVQETSLEEHLIWQLHASHGIDELAGEDIAEAIIRNLDVDGFLAVSLEEIGALCDVPVTEVEAVLKVVQGFDPVGIAARNLSECLEIQWKYYDLDTPYGLEMIQKHIDDLQHRRLTKIAKELGISEERVQETADVIGTLEPRPARQYQTYENEYLIPDVFVEKVDGQWEVRINDDGTPPLRISTKYRQMLQNPEGISDKERAFIQDKFRAAVWLIRNIEQRKKTLYKVTKCIVDLQKEFLENGISDLHPMRLRDVADIVGVHEATVCRVVNNKYVQTPQGLFELKFFFSTGLDTDNGADASVKAVMDRLEQMIAEENPKKPYSDQKITEILNKEGIRIARRTVAKYRERLGILPTSRRKRV